ncbi:DNA replication and repair protein RecF [Clostridium tepidiprofundi DSM 19306]|uniref:DNA replication and repair protein RecF n=1 Tax=Clostridium tepidiprofundi DSM 19306 TaxID=1121338 RepID=A0A151AWX6_9CLOT|nr:AAA family ATPase [Clostridium tepidiprofundi]KYH32062.1 DNA replication and repair protein RecF [Clostridium tepidiprofundi DSM 19306]
MSIDKICLKNITAFDELKMDFSKGINVIIGENGTGKTTLLKMIYAACEWSNETMDEDKTKNIFNYFNYGKKDINLLKNYDRKDTYSVFEATSKDNKFEFNLSYDAILKLGKWSELGIKSIFIPTTEMLSHSKGFLAMNQNYSMPFDATQIDIIVNAELPETRNVSKLNQKLLNIISKVIDGEVIYENDTFYVVKNNGMKVEFSFEAEGLRKFGLLWKLIRNGLIEKDTILLWDEPEANINPELMPVLIDVLLELQRNGVQVFIATHSYNLAKYFEIKRTEKDNVLFHNLYKEKKLYKEKIMMQKKQ